MLLIGEYRCERLIFMSVMKIWGVLLLFVRSYVSQKCLLITAMVSESSFRPDHIRKTCSAFEQTTLGKLDEWAPLNKTIIELIAWSKEFILRAKIGSLWR